MAGGNGQRTLPLDSPCRFVLTTSYRVGTGKLVRATSRQSGAAPATVSGETAVDDSLALRRRDCHWR